MRLTRKTLKVTIPCLSIKFMHHICTTVNTYHATKLMGNDQCLSHALCNHIRETLWMGRGDAEE